METIKVPTWALPICAAAMSGAIAWGSMQASAQATNEEVERVASILKDVEADTASNTTNTALNSQPTKHLSLIHISEPTRPY